MSLIVWTRYFLYKHVYEVDEKIVYQDNKSKILLQKNVVVNSDQIDKLSNENIGKKLGNKITYVDVIRH